MKKVNNIEDMKTVIIERYTELEDINPKYLSETGLAAMEAYRAILWHIGFHDNIQTLSEDEAFMNLVNISGKHPEYYKILRMTYRRIESLVKGD